MMKYILKLKDLNPFAPMVRYRSEQEIEIMEAKKLEWFEQFKNQ